MNIQTAIKTTTEYIVIKYGEHKLHGRDTLEKMTAESLDEASGLIPKSVVATRIDDVTDQPYWTIVQVTNGCVHVSFGFFQ